MKRLYIFFISASFLFASCSVPTPTTASVTATSDSEPDLFATPWEDRSPFKSGLVASEQSILSELPHASVYHIEFNIAEDLYHISGMEEVRYTNAEDVPLDQVQLRLFPNILGGEMTVSNLTADGESITPRLELQDSLLIVPFAAPLAPGQSIILRMDFAITVPQSVELNYGMLAYFDDVLALAHTYPMIAVYDDAGWNAEIPAQSGDVAYADTSFFLVKITAPKNLRVVTAGHVIHSSENGEMQTVQIASGP
ncbi:MAG TPA: hypothetical protein VFH34_02395, partial [Anaerolineales bacterium]|nr:hypothetical protein [Anaerolineales bacterium]